MSERKVLNKYYPPDFDPSKIPRLRLSRDRQYTVRLMAPCNMRCKTCGEYIYKGKKFNARKETVQNEEYLGIKIFRFYIKCTRCLAEITFKTDPENADYIVEHGATRNFQALKLAEEAAAKEAKELEEEEKGNPMKLLENRTKASKQEMELMENLEELKDLNQRHAKVDLEKLLKVKQQQLIDEIKREEDEDEAFIKSCFGKVDGHSIKRIRDEEESSLLDISKKMTSPPPAKTPKLVSSGIGILTKKSKGVLVKKKNESPSSETNSNGVPFKQTSSSNNQLSGQGVATQDKPNALSMLGAYSDSDSN
ncbi:splicing factor YJU2 [Parasteatoda tepidariorum]|uniref:splicing factor YJU2 n=1 Tax=Parasteatoda tepidariorum TaxID=114398 RepID=UPI00077FB3E3|nr:splicing factor YJU2 [Parasteatoda tepidariorum]